MGDSLKAVSQLQVGGDGRTSDNWSSYQIELEGVLSDKKVEGIFLDGVLLNQGSGKQPDDPGRDEATWLARPPAGRTDQGYADAVTAMESWSRANRVCHGWIMRSVPDKLKEACAQRRVAHELWRYLQDRFGEDTLTSVAALWVRLLSLRLDDFPGVSAYLTALGKMESDLRRANQQVPSSLIAGAILVGMGDRFPNTKEMLLAQPTAQQTKEYFALRLLEAEKNAKVSADLNSLSMGHKALLAVPKQNAANNRFPRCNYIRKHNGRGRYAIAGRPCPRRHPPGEQCWAKADDAWLAANPGLGPADLPQRNFPEIRSRQQQAAVMQGGSSSAGSAGQSASGSLSSGASSYVPEVFDDGSFLGYLLADTMQKGEGNNTQDNAQAMHTQVSSSSSDVVVALDSGATASCFKQGTDFRPLSKLTTGTMQRPKDRPDTLDLSARIARPL